MLPASWTLGRRDEVRACQCQSLASIFAPTSRSSCGCRIEFNRKRSGTGVVHENRMVCRHPCGWCDCRCADGRCSSPSGRPAGSMDDGRHRLRGDLHEGRRGGCTSRTGPQLSQPASLSQATNDTLVPTANCTAGRVHEAKATSPSSWAALTRSCSVACRRAFRLIDKNSFERFGPVIPRPFRSYITSVLLIIHRIRPDGCGRGGPMPPGTSGYGDRPSHIVAVRPRRQVMDHRSPADHAVGVASLGSQALCWSSSPYSPPPCWRNMPPGSTPA